MRREGLCRGKVATGQWTTTSHSIPLRALRALRFERAIDPSIPSSAPSVAFDVTFARLASPAASNPKLGGQRCDPRVRQKDS